jgi:hypothetical protein
MVVAMVGVTSASWVNTSIPDSAHRVRRVDNERVELRRFDRACVLPLQVCVSICSALVGTGKTHSPSIRAWRMESISSALAKQV